MNKRHTELTFLKGIFFWNGYTENFLDKFLRQIFKMSTVEESFCS